MLCKINATKSYEKVNNKRTKISLQTLYSFVLVLCLVTQWCPTLCNKLTVAHQAPLSMQIFQARILDWVAMPYPRGLPNPGIEPRCPTLQADSLPAELPGKPMEYYTATERNEIRSLVDVWMNLGSVIQSEVSQKEKNKYCILTHIYGI